MTITFDHISLQHVFNIIPPSLVLTKFKEKVYNTISVKIQYFNSFGMLFILFRYIYKGIFIKISTNITFLFYKEIYMKYLILHYEV